MRRGRQRSGTLVRIAGALDRCDAAAINGWACFREDPARKARLEIFAGDRLLGGCVADMYRADLVKDKIGDGHCAFYFAPPPDMPESELRRIVVRIVDTEFVFRSGLRWLLREPRAAAGQAARPKLKNRFRTCILHIGVEKTGTTTLQSFLAINRQALAEAGYFVPLSLAPNAASGMLNHIHLATCAMDDARFREDLRPSVGVHDADSLRQHRHAVLSALEDEVAKRDGQSEVMILSNEHCQSRLVRPHEIANLKELLDPFCDQYKIVVYLRAQHELAMSQYGMFIAHGVCNIDMFPPMPPPPDYAREVYTNARYFDYHDLLLRWSAIFGEEAISPRLYTMQHLRNRDIIDDFMQSIPVAEECLVRPPSKNYNVSETAQRFMINLFAHLDNAQRPGARRMRERIRALLQARYPGSGIAPARAAVAEFLERFQKSNEQVRLRWFPELTKLFDADLSQFPETQAAIEMSAEELYPIILDLLSADQGLAANAGR